MKKRIRNQELTTFTRVLMLIALYFLGGLVGKTTTFLSGSVALVWPPAGIALAAILLFGYRFWPGVALGAVLFSFMDGVPFGFFTLGTAIGNTMGAIVCAFLLKKIIAFDNAMERTRDVTGYIGLACFLGTTVNAAFNVVGLAYSGTVAWDNLFPAILVWWVPNALAALVVAPLIITWATPSATRWNARLVAEAALCGAGLVGGTLISFNSWFVYGIQNYPLAYPERFAQEALGHNSKAVHRSYSRKAKVRLPSLESYERQAAEGQIIQLPPLSPEREQVAHLGQTVG